MPSVYHVEAMNDVASSKIRVAHVIATLDDAGAERQMALLVTRLDPSRFSPSVFTLVRGGDRLESLLADAGVPHRCLSKRHKCSPGTLLQLRSLLRKEAPHIVHTWLFTANTYGRIAAMLAGAPHIVASERAEDPWKGPLHTLVDIALARATDAVVANSQAVADAVRKRLGPVGRLQVIHNGVELPHSPPVPRQELGADEKDLICLFAGRLEPQKNVVRLLKAFQMASPTHPRLRLLIAGDGPLRNELETLARDLGIGDQTRFLGYRKDLPGIMKSVDFLVLPSLWEGMSNVLLEAMLLGLPVAASRIPSITEFMEEGREGLLFDPENVQDIAETIAKAVSTPDLLNECASRARSRANQYDVDSMVAQYERLYSEVMKGG